MALRCAQSRDWFQDRWKRETHHSLFIHHHPCIHNIFSWIPSFCNSRNIDINIRNYRQQYSLMNKLNTWIALALILPLCRALSETRRASIVTGANGYVAREVVQELMKINDGRIYCLVRPARIESESQYWSEKSDCITVMPYDMLDGGATIQQALEQASRETEQICVYHIASVFGPTEDHVQTAKDNVQGTEDLVKALAKYQNDCRLVVTSSMAAVRSTGQKPLNGEYYTDKDWNDRSKLGENWGSSYQWSKAQSEKRAWELAEEHNNEFHLSLLRLWTTVGWQIVEFVFHYASQSMGVGEVGSAKSIVRRCARCSQGHCGGRYHVGSHWTKVYSVQGRAGAIARNGQSSTSCMPRNWRW
jgi:nucleoside-diphosphate-sugar epimerase